MSHPDCIDHPLPPEDSASRAAHSLQFGSEYPYDDYNREPADWAHQAARGVIAELRDRRGFDHAFHEVLRPDIRLEIVQSLAAIIRASHPQPPTP